MSLCVGGRIAAKGDARVDIRNVLTAPKLS